uniref:TM2 domain-containing protein almondex n=1 Tax=Bactrocera dorsalis TaxID=27457 RepID=A0A034V6N8_BACDO
MRHRRCIVINMRSALALIMIFIFSGIRQSQTAGGNLMETETKLEGQTKNVTNNNDAIPLTIKSINDTNVSCPGGPESECSTLPFPCIRCNYNYSCHYGREINVTCTALDHVQCQGNRTFVQQMNCRYCYQTELWQQSCALRGNCNSVNGYFYRTNCTVHSDVFCLGNRSFTRNIKCNWTQGYRWSTALIISITLGGFGADRFYLGHWQEGIGKLFSFGGLGVWTIIDVILISLHYLGPADGSLYI